MALQNNNTVISPKNIATNNVYAPNKGEAKLIELQETDESSITVGDFNPTIRK